MEEQGNLRDTIVTILKSESSMKTVELALAVKEYREKGGEIPGY